MTTFQTPPGPWTALSLSQGRGTVVTGRIEQGIVKVGEEIEIIGIQPATKTIVTGKHRELSLKSWLHHTLCLDCWVQWLS